MFGRAGLGLAATAAIVGMLMGRPDATPDRAFQTQITTAVEERAAGTEVADANAVLTTIAKLIAPSGVDRAQVLDAIGRVSFAADYEGHRFTVDLARDHLAVTAQ